MLYKSYTLTHQPRNEVFRIFNAEFLGETVPSGFNAVKIELDASASADLDWKKTIEIATDYILKGYSLFWEIHLGLFLPPYFPLSDQTQYLALSLSLRYFRDHVWTEFKEATIGASIYQGKADFSQGYLWNEEQTLNLQEWLHDNFHEIQTLEKEIDAQSDSLGSFSEINHITLGSNPAGRRLLSLFCRNAVVEYLDLLRNYLPDELSTYILIDTSSVTDPFQIVQLLDKEGVSRLHLGMTESILPITALTCAKEHNVLSSISRDIHSGNEISIPSISVGISIPSLEMCKSIDFKVTQEAINKLLQSKIAFRIISEVKLTTEWDGLDYLLVDSKHVTHQEKRKLQGFCAAGGTIVTLGDKIGLAFELTFSEWITLIIDCE